MTTTLTDRLNNAFAGGAAIKAPVRVASTANLTLSGYQTIDGIAMGASDASAELNMRVLVRNQTNSSANGIYEMASGAWSRTRDFDGSRDVVNGTLVWVSTGASQGGGFYNVTNSDPIIPDTSTAITFTAADVIAATAAASSAAAFAACAYVAAGSAYVAAGSAYVAAGSASVAAGSAITAASSAASFASCAYVAAGSAYAAAGSAYVAAGSAITNATSAATAAGSAVVAAASAYVAANSAYVAAGSAYVAAGCAYVAAGCAYAAAACAAAGGTVGTGSTGQLAFYSSATTPVVMGASTLVYNTVDGLTIGASGVVAGALALASTGGGNTTLKGSTAAITYTWTFPSSVGSSGQLVRLNTGGGLIGFVDSPITTASTGQVAFYSSAAVVRGASEFTYDSVGGLALGSSGVTAGALTLASTGGGNTIIRGSTTTVPYSFVLPSSLGSSGQVVQLNAGGVLGFATAASGGFTLGTENTTTGGTAVTFGSIPAGTKKIVISFVGLSTNTAAADVMVQIGDAGGLETSGYLGTGMWVDTTPTITITQFTTGFPLIPDSGSGLTYTGHITLTLEDAANFTWVSSSVMGGQNASDNQIGSGSKSLSAELTQVSITTIAGTPTFDANQGINIMYIG